MKLAVTIEESRLMMKCCFSFTSTETVGLSGTGVQDVHLDFHTQLLSSDISPPLRSYFIVHPRVNLPVTIEVSSGVQGCVCVCVCVCVAVWGGGERGEKEENKCSLRKNLLAGW